MIVIANKPGQLGNRLFVFAHFIAFAIEHGITVSDPAFDEYARLFPATERDIFCRYPRRRSLIPPVPFLRTIVFQLVRFFATVAARLPSRMPKPWGLIRLGWRTSLDLSEPDFVSIARDRRVVIVQGWLFQSGSLLAKHSNEVRDFFRPHRTTLGTVTTLTQKARADADLLIGVHLRRGDYRRFLHGRYFFTTEDYAQVMRSAAALFPSKRVRFLLVSDEALNPESFSDLDVVFGSGEEIEDVIALSLCDLLMGPPSTFSMWASFFGKVPLYMVQEVARVPTEADFRIRTSHMEFPEVRDLEQIDSSPDDWPWAP